MAQFTASGQKVFGIPLAERIDRTMFITVRFFLSATPFCCGVKAVVSWRLIPSSRQKSENSLECRSRLGQKIWAVHAPFFSTAKFVNLYSLSAQIVCAKGNGSCGCARRMNILFALIWV